MAQLDREIEEINKKLQKEPQLKQRNLITHYARSQNLKQNTEEHVIHFTSN